ncbi:MAG: hypothetical protein ABI655_10615 [Phenylobacterium sp.]
MAAIHTLKIAFDGGLQPGPEPWLWATVEVAIEDATAIRPTVTAKVPLAFDGEKGVFEMRELALATFRGALEAALAAAEGKSAEQLSFPAA